jgi:hypothetical protein
LGHDFVKSAMIAAAASGRSKMNQGKSALDMTIRISAC